MNGVARRMIARLESRADRYETTTMIDERANVTNETSKGFAQKFLEEHEAMEKQLGDANARIAELESDLTAERLVSQMRKDQYEIASGERNTYLRYAVELSAQLQFLVAGSARALKIAQNVRIALEMNTGGANIPEVSGADVAQLENIIERLGDVQMQPPGSDDQSEASRKLAANPIHN